MTGPAAAWTGTPPTSSPPASRAAPGNRHTHWRSFARQWQPPGEAAHTTRPSRTATPPRTRTAVRCGRREVQHGRSHREPGFWVVLPGAGPLCAREPGGPPVYDHRAELPSEAAYARSA